MSKVLVPILIGVAIIGVGILTGGISLAPSLALSSAGVASVSLGLSTTVLGGVLLAAGAGAILSGIEGALIGAPKIGQAQLSRLNPTLVPGTARKMVFGETAMALDTRYIEPSGEDQEFFDYIIVLASHAIQSLDEIWFEDRLAWTSGGGVDAYYKSVSTGGGVQPYLWVDVRLEGAAANAIAINGGTRWSSSCRLTGCAYIRLRIKRSGYGKKGESPLAAGLPGRVTAIGKGAKVYDPRRDSTNGGSGSHRPDDQSTWEYTSGGTVLGTNPALQALWVQLGWRIAGKLALGGGLPPARLDLASYIAAANLCDEAVTLAAGGTQRRYETHGVFGEDQAPLNILDALMTSCAGEITDATGRLGIWIAHNDLGGAIPAFGPDDTLGEVSYDPCPSLHETINLVRCQYTDPSRNSLFQLIDAPPVSVTSPDGIERSTSLQLGQVQDGNRAQRLLKQLLQREQFKGVATTTFGVRGLGLKLGSVITYTFPPLGFTAKLFRVRQIKLVVNSGRVEVVLREEHPSIYAWDRDEQALVVAAPPILFDPRNDPRLVLQGSDIGVDDNSTQANNLQLNALLTNDTTGYNLTSGWMQRAAGLEGPPTPWVLSTTAASSAGAQVIFPKSPVAGGRRIVNSIWVLRKGNLTSLTLAADCYDALNSASGIGPVGGAISIVPAAVNVWQRFPVSGLNASNAGFIGLTVDNMTGNDATVQVALGEIAYDLAVDGNATLEVPPSVTIRADYSGTVLSGQLPRDVQGTRRKGTADVSASTTWSATGFTGCTASIDGDGTVTITDCATSGKISWVSLRDGVPLNAETTVLKQLNDPPSTSGGGGGTGGGSSGSGSPAYDSSIGDTTGSSYGSANSDILEVTVGSAGQVDLTFPSTYSRVGSGTVTQARGKWQWRISGGTFADVGSEISQIQAFTPGEPDSGYIEVNQSKTGLTSGSVYQFQLLLRNATGSGVLGFAGTATAAPT